MSDTASSPRRETPTDNTVVKTAYKPLGLVFGMIGGALANIVFGQIWKRVTDAPSPPNATDEDYSAREVLLAGLLQGAIFGLVKTAVDRAGMRGVQRLLRVGPYR